MMQRFQGCRGGQKGFDRIDRTRLQGADVSGVRVRVRRGHIHPVQEADVVESVSQARVTNHVGHRRSAGRLRRVVHDPGIDNERTEDTGVGPDFDECRVLPVQEKSRGRRRQAIPDQAFRQKNRFMVRGCFPARFHQRGATGIVQDPDSRLLQNPDRPLVKDFNFGRIQNRQFRKVHGCVSSLFCGGNTEFLKSQVVGGL